jgi:hypothetical protein
LGEALQDEVLAAALIDRILHHCYIAESCDKYRVRQNTELQQAMNQGRAENSSQVRSRKRGRAVLGFVYPPSRVCNLRPLLTCLLIVQAVRNQLSAAAFTSPPIPVSLYTSLSTPKIDAQSGDHSSGRHI